MVNTALKRLAVCGIVVVFFILSLSTFAQGIRYVKSDGTGDGSSWGNAAGPAQLQSFLSAPTSEVSEVWIAKGRYSSETVTNAYTVASGKKVYGGFAGGEGSIAARTDIHGVNETILTKGAQIARIVMLQAGSDADNRTTLDGLTITGGKWNSTNSGDVGIGVYANNFSLVYDCIITENGASSGVSGGAGGTGVYLLNGIVDSCIISKNEFHCGWTWNTASAVVTGAGALLNDPDGVLKNSIIHSNAARNSDAGGVTVLYGTVENCLVYNNHSQRVGGGLYIVYNGRVRNTLIANNYANNAGGGDGLRVRDQASALAIITNCTIVNNSSGSPTHANSSGLRGNGAAYTTLTNCVAWGNNSTHQYHNASFSYSASSDENQSGTNFSISLLNTEDSSPKFITPTSFKGRSSSDVQFQEFSTMNWSLNDASWLINRGTTGSWTSVDKDIARNDRIQKGYVDIGAYESAHKGVVADLVLDDISKPYDGTPVVGRFISGLPNTINFTPTYEYEAQGSATRIPAPTEPNTYNLYAVANEHWNVNVGPMPFTISRADDTIVCSTLFMHPNSTATLTPYVESGETPVFTYKVKDGTSNISVDAATGEVTSFGVEGTGYVIITKPETGRYNACTKEVAVEVLNTPLYTVTVVDGRGSGTYPAGETVNISTTLSGDEQFAGWESDEIILGSEKQITSTSFDMISKDITITAVKKTYASPFRYITTNGSILGNGLSWKTASTIDSIHEYFEMNTISNIRIAGGSYTTTLASADELSTYVIARDLTLSGAWNPTTALQDPSTQTTLLASSGKRVINLQSKASLSHLTIKGDLNFKNENGGGLYINGANTIVDRCVITECGAKNGAGCFIASTATNSTISNSIFTFNNASDEAGAIWGGAVCHIKNCVVIGNHAVSGGGGFMGDNKASIILNSVFIRNTSQSANKMNVAGHNGASNGSALKFINSIALQGYRGSNSLSTLSNLSSVTTINSVYPPTSGDYGRVSSGTGNIELTSAQNLEANYLNFKSPVTFALKTADTLTGAEKELIRNASYDILESSLLIKAGENATAPWSLNDLDIAGNPRVWEDPETSLITVDIGAYECPKSSSRFVSGNGTGHGMTQSAPAPKSMLKSFVEDAKVDTIYLVESDAVWTYYEKISISRDLAIVSLASDSTRIVFDAYPLETTDVNVYLRGFTLAGIHTTATPLLKIEDCTISGMTPFQLQNSSNVVAHNVFVNTTVSTDQDHAIYITGNNNKLALTGNTIVASDDRIETFIAYQSTPLNTQITAENSVKFYTTTYPAIVIKNEISSIVNQVYGKINVTYTLSGGHTYDGKTYYPSLTSVVTPTGAPIPACDTIYYRNDIESEVNNAGEYTAKLKLVDPTYACVYGRLLDDFTATGVYKVSQATPNLVANNIPSPFYVDNVYTIVASSQNSDMDSTITFTVINGTGEAYVNKGQLVATKVGTISLSITSPATLNFAEQTIIKNGSVLIGTQSLTVTNNDVVFINQPLVFNFTGTPAITQDTAGGITILKNGAVLETNFKENSYSWTPKSADIGSAEFTFQRNASPNYYTESNMVLKTVTVKDTIEPRIAIVADTTWIYSAVPHNPQIESNIENSDNYERGFVYYKASDSTRLAETPIDADTYIVWAYCVTKATPTDTAWASDSYIINPLAYQVNVVNDSVIVYTPYVAKEISLRPIVTDLLVYNTNPVGYTTDSFFGEYKIIEANIDLGKSSIRLENYRFFFDSGILSVTTVSDDLVVSEQFATDIWAGQTLLSSTPNAKVVIATGYEISQHEVEYSWLSQMPLYSSGYYACSVSIPRIYAYQPLVTEFYVNVNRKNSPAIKSATLKSDGSVLIDYTLPSKQVVSPTDTTYYAVYRQTVNSTLDPVRVTDWTHSPTSLIDPLLPTGGAYSYYVLAAGTPFAEGLSSTPKHQIKIKTQTQPPVITNATAFEARRVRLSWDAPDADVPLQYRVYRVSGTKYVAVTDWIKTSETLFYDTTKEAKVAYVVVAQDIYAGGFISDYSSSVLVNLSEEELPEVTINASATQGNLTDITISFNNDSGFYAGIVRYAKNRSGEWVKSMASSYKIINQYVDETAVPGVDYEYDVIFKIDPKDTVSRSKTKSRIPAYRGISPATLTATQGSSSSLVVKWKMPKGSTHVKFERFDGTSWTSLYDWVKMTSYKDVQAQMGAVYSYRVTVAADETGRHASAPSEVMGWISLTPPTKVTAGQSTGHYAQIVWDNTKASSQRTGFIIGRSTNGKKSGTAWEVLPQTLSYTATSFEDYTATPGVTYTYFVSCATASDSEGSEHFTRWSSGVKASRLLSNENNVVASFDKRYDGIKISWNAVDGAGTYSLYRNDSPSSLEGNITLLTKKAIADREYMDYDINLVAGKRYYYFVKSHVKKSYNAKTSSDYTNLKDAGCVMYRENALVFAPAGVALSMAVDSIAYGLTTEMTRPAVTIPSASKAPKGIVQYIDPMSLERIRLNPSNTKLKPKFKKISMRYIESNSDSVTYYHTSNVALFQSANYKNAVTAKNATQSTSEFLLDTTYAVGQLDSLMLDPQLIFSKIYTPYSTRDDIYDMKGVARNNEAYHVSEPMSMVAPKLKTLASPIEITATGAIVRVEGDFVGTKLPSAWIEWRVGTTGKVTQSKVSTRVIETGWIKGGVKLTNGSYVQKMDGSSAFDVVIPSSWRDATKAPWKGTDPSTLQTWLVIKNTNGYASIPVTIENK